MQHIVDKLNEKEVGKVSLDEPLKNIQPLRLADRQICSSSPNLLMV